MKRYVVIACCWIGLYTANIYAASPDSASADVMRTPRSETPVSHSDPTASQWNMTPSEWARYQSFANGVAAYRHGDKSPLHVMALYTEGDEQRRWVDRLVRFEKAENDREDRANRLFYDTAMRLFPPATTPALSPTAVSASRYLAFVSDACSACDQVLPRLFSLAERVRVDLYLVGAADAEDVSRWAVRKGVPRRLVPGRLTINVDNGTFARLNRLAIEVPALYAVDDRQKALPVPVHALDELLASPRNATSAAKVTR